MRVCGRACVLACMWVTVNSEPVAARTWYTQSVMHFGYDCTEEASQCRGAGQWQMLWYSVRYVMLLGLIAARCAWLLRLQLCATRLTSLQASTFPFLRSMGWVRLLVSFPFLIYLFNLAQSFVRICSLHFHSLCLSVGSAPSYFISDTFFQSCQHLRFVYCRLYHKHLSMLWCCWLGGRKGIIICLGRGAYLHIAQLMPLPLTISSPVNPDWFYLSGTGSPG